MQPISLATCRRRVCLRICMTWALTISTASACGVNFGEVTNPSTGSTDCEACPVDLYSLNGSSSCEVNTCEVGFVLESAAPTTTCGAQWGWDENQNFYLEHTSESGMAATPCGCSGSGQVITDGSASSELYSPDLRCWWIISGVNPQLQFSRFDLEANYDFLNVYRCTDSTCATKFQEETYTNEEDDDGEPPTIGSVYTYTTQWLLLTLETDQSAARLGFSVSWDASPVEDCQASTSSCSAGSYSVYGSSLSACSPCPADSYSPDAVFECTCVPGYYPV